MKQLIRWAVRNSPAMNVLMIGILVLGGLGFFALRREVFPEFDLEIVLISVPYPGASPEEVEEGICEKIEESVRSIAGIRKQTSIAQEGSGSVVLEIEPYVADVDKIVNEVRSEVERIPSFPELAEDAEVKQITIRQPAIKVGVIGPPGNSLESRLALREVAERVRSELLQLAPAMPSHPLLRMLTSLRVKQKTAISQATIKGAPAFQIDVEIPEQTLRRYGLTLREVAQTLRRENIELPGGTLKSQAQDILLRGKNRRRTGEEIAQLPVIKQEGGVVLTVGDLGHVKDGFADTPAISRIEGEPGLTISVDRTANEDLFAVTDTVHEYLRTAELPPGYRLVYWQDRSVDVRERIDLLARNGIQGLLLVFLVLALFLELRLAFWVALGIPISIFGACVVLAYGGQTLNMLSMFAFLLALGIVVDDAIVIGENIYAHREMGKPFIQAAIDGAYEVAPSVFASVATTIVAFAPLMFVSGVMGKFIAVMPVAVIAMLLISLGESTFILPTHLAHRENLFLTIVRYLLRPFWPLGQLWGLVNRLVTRVLEWFIQHIYLPTLNWSLSNPACVAAGAVALLALTMGLVRSGVTTFVVFPRLDSNNIQATIRFPDGTPEAVTDEATRSVARKIQELDRSLSKPGSPIVRSVVRNVGSVESNGPAGPNSLASGGHVGLVEVELHPNTVRGLSSGELLALWRQSSASDQLLKQADSVTFGTPNFGPGGSPIEFKLLADRQHWAELRRAVEYCKEQLGEYQGVQDVDDDNRDGKLEYQFRVKENARSMGVTAADLAETIRSAYFGEEVQRLQRGRHELKLMVRYPQSERRSLADLNQLRVRTGDGSERPLTELAEVYRVQGASEINRIDQLRSITVMADVDEAKGNARQVIGDFQQKLQPVLASQFPHVRVRWEGQQEQSRESVGSLAVGLVIAMLVMYALLTFEFRSYLQPLLILSIVPFGFTGAVWGHALLRIPLTLFSVFGLVALTGVVVNDSIVLVDFINHRLRDGLPLREALLDAGRRRFRPVLLTSLTTIAGLLPLLTERSFQAQLLIPMAASLAFGLMVATVLVLYLVPTFYEVYGWALQRMGVELGREADVEDDHDVVRGEPSAGDPPVGHPGLAAS